MNPTERWTFVITKGGDTLKFTDSGWKAFVQGMKVGEFGPQPHHRKIEECVEGPRSRPFDTSHTTGTRCGPALMVDPFVSDGNRTLGHLPDDEVVPKAAEAVALLSLRCPVRNTSSNTSSMRASFSARNAASSCGNAVLSSPGGVPSAPPGSSATRDCPGRQHDLVAAQHRKRKVRRTRRRSGWPFLHGSVLPISSGTGQFRTASRNRFSDPPGCRPGRRSACVRTRRR